MNKKLYKMMDWARIEQIVYSEEDSPNSFLGAHLVDGNIIIQAFFPDADKCFAIIKLNNVIKEVKMDKVDDAGFFATLIKPALNSKKSIKYHYRVMKGHSVYETEDPYRFDSMIGEDVLKSFSHGICYDIYKYMGAHVRVADKVKGVNFAVWAPNAVRVSVVGDFNNWDGRCHQMQRRGDSGVFEIFIPNIKEGEIYKYELKLKGGMVSLKSDPYAFYSQLRPETASVIYDIADYKWNDDLFLADRKNFQNNDKPMSVYELHLGSFSKSEDNGFLNYRVLAQKVIDYVKPMGYTHVELMPVMEHPLDESWGYQVIGHYAPTSRYGTPDDFMYFIDQLHLNGIGVILDWVPAHFPRDIHGLSSFDGTCLYEYSDPRKGYHPDWGTLVFDYGRPQVSNYLISSALFWINCYHADGLRLDAVASMLYLDYGRNGGEWVPNIYGGNENLEAVELLKHLNSINDKQENGAILIAEESTAWPKVTGDLNDGGLGFDYKWNMGWMNDLLGFMRLDPLYRSGHYSELTFSMIYAYSERFMLAFSHDEVVHGKSSMIGKMPGGREDKFANMRLAYAYMFTHPGKKLTFMGQDIAEFDEWNEKREVEWSLLEYDEHSKFNQFIKTLNILYKNSPALYELDNLSDGFEWINNISANETIIVFLRKDKAGNELLVVCNFSGADWNNYKIGVPYYGKFKEIFSTDRIEYGGNGYINPRVKTAKYDECDGRDFSIRIKVPALSVSIYTCEKCVYEGNPIAKKVNISKSKQKTIKSRQK